MGQLKGKIFLYEITILEHHLDTYGHVNNAKYLEILEEARWDLVTRQGWGLKRVMETQKGPVLLELLLKFHKELKLRDRILIQTQCVEYGKLIGILEQKMLSHDGELLCTARFSIALFDLKARKLLRPTDEWLRILQGERPDARS